MKILLVEPYFTGSHASWANGYQEHSRHYVEILKLSGANWKWRMHGGAVTLARRFMDMPFEPDIIFASDMLDLGSFLALTRERTANTTTAMYFHENQLSYPWSPTDRDVQKKRDKHYGFINYASAMAADAVFFNSRYHLESFFEELERLLKHFPDHNEIATIEALRLRSEVLPLGLSLARFDGHIAADVAAGDGVPLVVWNHRWEYDKNPEAFFHALGELAHEGVDFQVAVLGENFSRSPDVFDAARERLASRVVQYGYADSFEEYAGWLHAADILPVTSYQDFFGASVVEAVYCRCRPLLPKRLAYPELIPEAFHEHVFYEGDQFLPRLRALLAGRVALLPGLKEAAARYDWTNMAALYDDTLESVVEARIEKQE